MGQARTSVDDKQFCSDRREGTMGFRIVSDLITEAGLENKFSPVFELGVQLALETQEYVSFLTPVIRQIPGRVFDHADADAFEVPGTPKRDSSFASVFRRLDGRPVSRFKWNVGHFHDDLSKQRLAPTAMRSIGTCFLRHVFDCRWS